MKEKNIGIDVPKPKKECSDANCPFHGSVKLRGRQFTGTVVSDKPQKTVIVEWERRKPIPKYERYEKRKSRVQAHNPGCINAIHGDKVLLAETRPMSKTKHFVVIQKLGVDDAKLIKESESEERPDIEPGKKKEGDE